MHGVSVSGANVTPKQLKQWLTFPETWGPTQWGPIPFLPAPDVLVTRMENAWGSLDTYAGLATVNGGKGSYVAGLQIGNVFVGIQPALGVEGDPMRLLSSETSPRTRSTPRTTSGFNTRTKRTR